MIFFGFTVIIIGIDAIMDSIKLGPFSVIVATLSPITLMLIDSEKLGPNSVIVDVIFTSKLTVNDSVKLGPCSVINALIPTLGVNVDDMDSVKDGPDSAIFACIVKEVSVAVTASVNAGPLSDMLLVIFTDRFVFIASEKLGPLSVTVTVTPLPPENTLYPVKLL